MNVKRSLVALAATGATAAVVFGGSAVATSFTSQSDQQFAEAQGATTGVQVTGGTFDAKDLVPGGVAKDVGTVTITNNGTADADATVNFQGYTVKTPGSNGGNPDPARLEFNIQGFGTRTASQLSGSSLDFGVIGAGQSVQADVTVDLAAGAGNDWNGADAYLPYSVTLTAGS
jgi:hypothetical protein